MEKSILVVILFFIMTFFSVNAFSQSQIGIDQQAVENERAERSNNCEEIRFDPSSTLQKMQQSLFKMAHQDEHQIMSASSGIVFSKNPNVFNMFKGTVWTFSYTIGSTTFEDTIYFDETVFIADDGKAALPFTDEYGKLGIMAYTLSGAPSLASAAGISQPFYGTFLSGTIIDKMYYFNTINNSSVYGSYVHYSNSRGEFSYFYSLIGFKHGSNPYNAPADPRGLAANAVSYRKILLRWTDKSIDEDGFKIERKKRGCNSSYMWSQIATVSENINTYDDVGFDSNTQYSYRVRAYNSFHNSEYSNCGTTVSGRSGTPSSPVNLVASYVSSSKVDLTWGEWSSNVTGFKIYRNLNGADSWTLLASIGPYDLSYSDTNAAKNQTTKFYSYYMQACNNAGCSPPTYMAGMPHNPKSLIATTGSNDKIILEWEDKCDNERGFEIYRKTGDCSSFASWEKVKSAGINRTTISDKKDLISGTTYSYKIRAYCRSWGLPYVYGYSDWSNCVSITAP